MGPFRALILGLFFLLCFPSAVRSAEPNFTIRLLSGSEVKADKAWIQGDFLFYERSGYTGTMRFTDIDLVIDRELLDKVASCVGGIEVAKRYMRESTALGYLSEEVRGFMKDCPAALEKLDRNSRLFEEAREQAARKK